MSLYFVEFDAKRITKIHNFWLLLLVFIITFTATIFILHNSERRQKEQKYRELLNTRGGGNNSVNVVNNYLAQSEIAEEQYRQMFEACASNPNRSHQLINQKLKQFIREYGKEVANNQALVETPEILNLIGQAPVKSGIIRVGSTIFSYDTTNKLVARIFKIASLGATAGWHIPSTTGSLIGKASLLLRYLIVLGVSSTATQDVEINCDLQVKELTPLRESMERLILPVFVDQPENEVITVDNADTQKIKIYLPSQGTEIKISSTNKVKVTKKYKESPRKAKVMTLERLRKTDPELIKLAEQARAEEQEISISPNKTKVEKYIEVAVDP